jgi:hypothetical protein
MIKVPYEVAHFQYSGDTLKSQENLKAESSEDVWEAKTSQAVLRLSIDPASVVNEVRVGVVSSMTVTVVAEKAEGGEEVQIAREFPCEYEAGKLCSKFAIGNEQANIRFSAVRLVLQNTKDWLPMKVLYVSLYAQSPSSNATTKRPSDTVTRTPEKRTKVEQDPATCSYSSILFGCRVVTIHYSEHVRRLCECMGAQYASTDFDRCTHCIVTADESSNELELLKEKNLQVVSMRWLEECLSARSRAQESAYVI